MKTTPEKESHLTTSVIGSNPKLTFLIKSCNMRIIVSEDFRTAQYNFDYDLLKIFEGEDSWVHTSPYPRNEFIKKTVTDHLDNGLGTVWIDRDDSKSSFKIYLDRSNGLNKFKINDIVKFKMVIEQTLESALIEQKGFFYKKYLIYFLRTFANECRYLNINIEFKNKQAKVLHSIPHNKENNEMLVFQKENMLPQEYYNVVLIVKSGFFSENVAYLTEKIFWIIIGAFIPYLITLLIG